MVGSSGSPTPRVGNAHSNNSATSTWHAELSSSYLVPNADTIADPNVSRKSMAS